MVQKYCKPPDKQPEKLSDGLCKRQPGVLVRKDAECVSQAVALIATYLLVSAIVLAQAW